MAMYDWSGNKNDMFNNSIEYQIYRNCTNNTSTSRRYSESSSGGLGIV